MELQKVNCKQQACFIISNSNVIDIRDSASRVFQSVYSFPNMNKVLCYETGACHLPQVLFVFVNSIGCLSLQYSYSYMLHCRYLSSDGSITTLNDSLTSLLTDPLFTISILQRYEILYISSQCLVEKANKGDE